MQKRILECVPNFSEGRDESVIQKITNSINNVFGAKVLHIDMGYAANRTVVTFAGEPEAVIEAAFQATKTASENIDMTMHTGVHPRIGATDVLPLIPISGITMAETIELSYKLAERIGSELKIPIFCYENSALKPERKRLENNRKGEYEGLSEKLNNPEWKPDFGPAKMNYVAGATILGAREFLLAYNVNLDTTSITVASEIASEIRGSGKIIIDEKGDKIKIAGLYKSVKAIGWFIEEFGKAQVSMNLTDYKNVGMHNAYETVQSIAFKYGVKVTGSELIGMAPLQAFIDSGLHFAGQNKLNDDELVAIAIEKLGLNELKLFNYKTRIIEYML